MQNVFGNRIISSGLWLCCSPHLNQCDVYLLGMLKHNECSINPYTEDSRKESIQNVALSILPAEFDV